MLSNCLTAYPQRFFACAVSFPLRFVGSYCNPILARILVAAFFLSSINLYAEPWIDTRNAWLRADIERLARAGIINVPINTWPLMWSGVIEDMQRAASAPRAPSVEGSFVRVMAAGKRAADSFESIKSLRLTVADEPPLSRHYGHDARE